MDELDKIIRESDIEKTSDNFTSEVMDRIRLLPTPKSTYASPVSFWFKLFMIGIFVFALGWTIISGSYEAGIHSGWLDIYQQGIFYIKDFFSRLLTWSNTYLWLLPSFLFSMAGILYLLSGRPGIDHQYH